MDQINDTLVSSIKIIAMMLLIIGGGGAFKQVLVDSGISFSDYGDESNKVKKVNEH